MSEPKPLLAPLTPAATSSRLWTVGGFIADTWTMLTDDDALPIEGQAIVSLARWRKEQNDTSALRVSMGILAKIDDLIDARFDNIGRLSVIALPFPKFTDGRSYSTARQLRQAGFKGQIRATGDVLLDQLPLMLRTGFDSFAITDVATIAALDAKSLPAVTRIYQIGTETTGRVWRSRRAVASVQPVAR